MIRKIALDLVVAAEKTGRFVDRSVDAAIERHAMIPRDAALLRTIVYGSVRHRGTLDAVIRAYARDGRLPKQSRVCELLRQALYQMLMLERVAPHAIVYEAVDLASGRGTKSSAGFVNGMLRAVQRESRRIDNDEAPGARSRDRIELEGGKAVVFERPIFAHPARDPAAYLAEAHSHPDWLVRRWRSRFGDEECERLLRAGNAIPPVILRVRGGAPARDELLERLAAAGHDAAAALRDDAIRLLDGGRIDALPGYESGEFVVQGEAAMEIGDAAGALAGELVLEIGSAPGGKTAQLAERVGDGMVIAVDSSPFRLRRLTANVARLELNRVAPLALDARRLPPAFAGRMDRVLLDVPCSNTGVLARRPEARWRLTESSLESLGLLQRGLLRAAAAAVRPGGTLIYATCSVEPEENEEMTADVLGAGFERRSEVLRMPGAPYADGGFHAIWVRSAAP